jgi:predicted phosphodiesterase
MTKILFAGDWHGNIQHARNVFSHACRVEADAIFQVGDFGFGWDRKQFKDTGGKVECVFTHKLAELVEETGIPLYWIDGNHENFDFLAHYMSTARQLDEDDGTFALYPNLFYVPRGTILEWSGVKFMCVGGACSVDRQSRTPGRSWWPQETLTDADVAKATNAGHAEVLISHDAPFESKIVDKHLNPEWGEQAVHDTFVNRHRLSMILKSSRASMVIHGHLHFHYVAKNGPMTIMGLHRDTMTMEESTFLFDTEVFHGGV